MGRHIFLHCEKDNDEDAKEDKILLWPHKVLESSHRESSSVLTIEKYLIINLEQSMVRSTKSEPTNSNIDLVAHCFLTFCFGNYPNVNFGIKYTPSL